MQEGAFLNAWPSCTLLQFMAKLSVDVVDPFD
jgi:hypothetical protein